MTTPDSSLIESANSADGSSTGGTRTTEPGNPYASRPNAPFGTDNRLLGILSLVGGLASIVFGQTIVLPIAAIVLGFIARRREPDSRAMATWGIVLGFLALFGWVAILIVSVAVAAPLFFISFF